MAQQALQKPLGYRINAAAQAIGVNRSTIYRLADEGKLKRVSLGAFSIITAESLHALVAGEA